MNYKKVIRSVFKIPIVERLMVNYCDSRIYSDGFTKFVALHSEYSKPSLRKTTKTGINYHLDISNLVDWYIYFGFKEPEKENLFSHISKGQMVIDVGANIGDMTLNFAKIVGETGKVIAFEPFPPMFLNLSSNLSLNSFENIEAYNLGLANEATFMEMEEPSVGNPGMNRITMNSSNKTTKISVVRLDDFLKPLNVRKIDVIKIDVEGYEHEVLKGAQEILTHQQPLLFIELDDNNLKDQGSSARKLIDFLELHNYRIIKATDNYEINANIDFTNCHYDIICTPKK